MLKDLIFYTSELSVRFGLNVMICTGNLNVIMITIIEISHDDIDEDDDGEDDDESGV